MRKQTNYNKDFFNWTQSQSSLIRAGKLDKLDLEHVAEEIESLGVSDKRALRSHLRNLILHMLKKQYQKSRHSKSWDTSISNAKLEIQLILDDSPSLRKELPKLIEQAYKLARNDAASETKLPLKTFPEECCAHLFHYIDDQF